MIKMLSKEKINKSEFKLLMSGSELFEICKANLDRKSIVIEYGSWLSNQLSRSLSSNDFNVKGRIFKSQIVKYFGTISNYFKLCDFADFQKNQWANFDLLMSADKLFKNCKTLDDKKQILIKYGNYNGKLEILSICYLKIL